MSLSFFKNDCLLSSSLSSILLADINNSKESFYWFSDYES